MTITATTLRRALEELRDEAYRETATLLVGDACKRLLDSPDVLTRLARKLADRPAFTTSSTPGPIFPSYGDA